MVLNLLLHLPDGKNTTNLNLNSPDSLTGGNGFMVLDIQNKVAHIQKANVHHHPLTTMLTWGPDKSYIATDFKTDSLGRSYFEIGNIGTALAVDTNDSLDLLPFDYESFTWENKPQQVIFQEGVSNVVIHINSDSDQGHDIFIPTNSYDLTISSDGNINFSYIFKLKEKSYRGYITYPSGFSTRSIINFLGTGNSSFQFVENEQPDRKEGIGKWSDTVFRNCTVALDGFFYSSFLFENGLIQNATFRGYTPLGLNRTRAEKLHQPQNWARFKGIVDGFIMGHGGLMEACEFNDIIDTAWLDYNTDEPIISGVEFDDLKGEAIYTDDYQDLLVVDTLTAIDELKDGVPTEGDSLNKLYNLIQNVVGVSASATDIADRNAQKTDLEDQQNIYVADATSDATVSAGWAIYKYLQPTDSFVKIMEQESIDMTMLTGGNGITVNGNEVNLGGELNQTSTILTSFSQANSKQFGVDLETNASRTELLLDAESNSPFIRFQVIGNARYGFLELTPNLFQITTGNASVPIIKVEDQGVEFDVSGVGVLRFHDAHGFVFEDHRLSSSGMRYAQDYSEHFDNRSLVDKAYVDKSGTKDEFITISANVTLDDSYSGKILLLTGIITITMPLSPSIGFNVALRNKDANIKTIDMNGSILEYKGGGAPTMANQHDMASLTFDGTAFLGVGDLT